jgi:hypothetical protein
VHARYAETCRKVAGSRALVSGMSFQNGKQVALELWSGAGRGVCLGKDYVDAPEPDCR